MTTTRPGLTPAVALSFVAFVLVGLSAGVGGVLIPAQISDYGIDMATIGLTFVTFSVGFFLGGTSVGALVTRLGLRGTVLLGGAAYVAAGLVTATRPSFVVLVAVQVLAGYGMGALESALMVHLSGLPSAASLLNRLHGFFGVGALLGPLLAARMLTAVAWPMVWLLLALLAVPVLGGLAWVLPTRVERTPAAAGRTLRDGMLARVLRQPAVMLSAVFLAVYVGLEISTGNWAYSYLVDGRGHGPIAAGYVVSGYWLGLLHALAPQASPKCGVLPQPANRETSDAPPRFASVRARADKSASAENRMVPRRPRAGGFARSATRNAARS